MKELQKDIDNLKGSNNRNEFQRFINKSKTYLKDIFESESDNNIYLSEFNEITFLTILAFENEDSKKEKFGNNPLKNYIKQYYDSVLKKVDVIFEQAIKEIKKRKYINTINNNNAFVIMAIKNKSEEDDILQAIKRASMEKNINATRVDDINHSGKISPLIINGIKNSRYIICDITEERPNVYYELGYAHGLDKEVIILAKEETKLHFDIKDYNVIFYSSLTNLENLLKERLTK